MKRRLWEKFCEVTGYCVWAVNEGMDCDENLFLSEEDAIEIGLINKIDKE